MSDPHLLTGAYALDALDDIERASVEHHLRDCPECAAEVRDFQEVAAGLAERVAAPPPPMLRARVFEEVARTRQVSPGSRASRTFRPAAPRRRSFLAAAAAVVVFAAGGVLGGLAWRADQEADQVRQEAAAITDVITDPQRREHTGEVSIGGEVTVVAADRNAVFAARDLPAPPADRRYQLWVVEATGTIRSAGLLEVENGSTQTLVEGVAEGAKLAVSVEPEQGSPQPTTKPVVAVDV
jgi:anti-sigma-K factor RskA